MMAVPPSARCATTPACSSRSAMCCRYSSIVSSMVEPGGRRPLEAAEGVPPGVGVNEDRAGLAANLRVVGPLEPFEAVVVDADVAEQVRRELLVRVEAAALLDEADAVADSARRRGAPRPATPAGARRRNAALVLEAIGERLPFAGRAVAERLAQLRDRLFVVVDFGRHRVDRIDVDAGREQMAAAIEDVAALGRRRARPDCCRAARAVRSAWRKTCR